MTPDELASLVSGDITVTGDYVQGVPVVVISVDDRPVIALGLSVAEGVGDTLLGVAADMRP